MPPGSPPGNRSFGLSGAGKGSAERSADWRKNYDEVTWPKSDVGFERRGVRQVKTYKQPAEQPVVELPPASPSTELPNFGV
jgi:hypothetical protein